MAVIVVVFGYGGNLLMGRGLHMLHVRHEERCVCVCVRRSCIFDLVYIFVCDLERKGKSVGFKKKKKIFFYWKV